MKALPTMWGHGVDMAVDWNCLPPWGAEEVDGFVGLCGLLHVYDTYM